MPSLFILYPPASMRSAHDVLCARTFTGLSKAGLASQGQELWPDWWAERLWHSKLPGRRTLFELGPARWGLHKVRQTCRESDVVWINGPASPLDETGHFESQLLAQKKPYIFHLQDDWFLQPKLGAVAAARVKIASLVVVPTEPLRDRILALFPSARVLVLEEPIDIERLEPVPPAQPSTRPFIVWSGHLNSQQDLLSALEPLGQIYRKAPFTLRILTRKPAHPPEFPFPVEWLPYEAAKEAALLSGAVAGIAPLPDTPYARCKGGYKVKTYLTAGVPPIASPVGHHSRMIEHGVNGFLASTEEEWEEALLTLLRAPDVAGKMGAAARQSAVAKYSHEALMPRWAERLRSVLPM